jgi:hypothetical protein
MARSPFTGAAFGCEAQRTSTKQMHDLWHRKLMPPVLRQRSHQLSDIESEPDGHDGAENQTLRRIVADQSIELRRLRERRDQDQPNAPEESV